MIWIFIALVLVGALVILLHLIGKRHNEREDDAGLSIIDPAEPLQIRDRTEFLGIQVFKNRPGNSSPLYLAVPTLRTDTVMMQAIPANERPF